MDNGKFVAAEACDSVLRPRKTVERARYLHQKIVAGGVSQRVASTAPNADRLEPSALCGSRLELKSQIRILAF